MALIQQTLCKSYIEKLLTHLEDNSDERDRYRKILHNALNDPMISKLMTTPLYTAIIVLLVKMGGTPPTKRYTLFQEYCEIVVKREQQKEMLPSLHDEYDWIMKLHAQIGFQLQVESETAENAAAELSSGRCRELIVHFLQDEEFDGELQQKAEDLYLAITNRLSFLSEVSGSDQEACVLFPLRSIQEYFAAEWLISFDDEDKLSEAMEIVSVSAYWRNVYLFVAGFFTKHTSRRNMNETLFRICQRNNGDENYESANPVAYRIARQGSRLALDLLCDNLFSRPVDQRRYLNNIAQLLDGDYDAILLTQRLPSKIANIFLQEKVIPHIQKTKSAVGFAFEFLWMMANNRNERAYEQLENIINEVTVPDTKTIRRLLSGGFDKVGEKAINTIYLWITEDRFADFCDPFWPNDKYWDFLSFFFARSSGMEFSLLALRQAVYRVMLESGFRGSNDTFSYPNRLLQKMIADNNLNELFYFCYTGNFDLYCRPIQYGKIIMPLLEYAEDFRSFQLNEMATLAEFLYSPSYFGVRRLLEAYSDLPKCCKVVFISLIRNCNWFLQELADRLLTSESEEKLFTHYDSTYVDACFNKDREMIDLIETVDFVSITRSNYWKEISLSYGKTVPQDLMQEILSIANENPFDEGLISFLYRATRAGGTISLELTQFIMRYFPLLFQSVEGVELALRLFDQAPLLSLVAGNVEYPKTCQISSLYLIEEEQANRLLDKIDHLAELGEEFLQAYALVPILFSSMKSKLMSKLMPNTVMHYYHAINTTGNQAALLGCILRILAGPVSDEQESIIREKLIELLQSDSFVFIWYHAVESFSMDGKKLVYKAITTLAMDTKQKNILLNRYAHAILEELEASPVERNQLIELSRSAHSDRHFL